MMLFKGPKLLPSAAPPELLGFQEREAKTIAWEQASKLTATAETEAKMETG